MWRSMLPDGDVQWASLPVHWGEAVLSTCKCTALELAVDSAYFARAAAVADLAEELRGTLNDDDDPSGGTDEGAPRRERDKDRADAAPDLEALRRRCHNALDIVSSSAIYFAEWEVGG